MGLQRKEVKVRGKNGKVYQRSMVVQAQAIGKRAGKSNKLHALNPWETHHVANVDTSKSSLGHKAQAYGSSGPGSTHSAFALIIGAMKSHYAAKHRHDSYTQRAAAERRFTGRRLGFGIAYQPNDAETAHDIAVAHGVNRQETNRVHWSHNFQNRYGESNIHEVHQDPRKWIR
jgi:hypothetical protein